MAINLCDWKASSLHVTLTLLNWRIFLGWMRKLQRKGTVIWRGKKLWRNACVFIC